MHTVSIQKTMNLFRYLLGSALAVLAFVAAGGGVMAQDKDIFPVPDNYRVEGIPEIEKSDVEKLFFDPSEIRSNLIWDADTKNRRLLVTDATNNIYLLDSPLKAPTKLIEKIVPYRVKVRPDGSGFAYTSDHEHEDNYQLYYYDFKEKDPKKLITLTGKDESIDSFIWSKTGDSLFYMRVDYDSKKSKLCRYNFQKEDCYSVDLKGIWSVIQDSGSKLLIKNFKAPSDQHLYVYEFLAGKLTPVDGISNSPNGFLVGDRVYWLSENNNTCQGKPCILTLNLKNNEKSRLKLPDGIKNLHEFKISPKGNNLLIQETIDGIDHLDVFWIRDGKIIQKIPQFISASYVVWNTRWLTDTEVVYTLENIGKPASIQSYDTKTKRTTDWTKERLPSQLENRIRSPQAIKWKSFDQKEISGYIVRPIRSEKRTPVLIFVHGGPPVLDKPVFNSQDIRLASCLGLTIIHTNIRGSDGFSKDFMDADNREKRNDPVKDVRALLDWIGKQPDLDADRIYLRGESYGGFIVLSTALQEPKRVKAVIAEYPLVSIRGYLSQSWIDEAARNEYGDPTDENLMKKLDELSPLGNAGRWNKIPLFMTRGKLDARVPEKDVTDLKTQLQNGGTDVWYIFSTADGHGFGGRYVFGAMYEFLKIQIRKEQKTR